MAQNITIAGASYSAVPSIQVPKTGSGTATFVDTSDADATAAGIMSGLTAYVNGIKLTGTASGGLEYESGTWSPSSNTTTAPTFYFNNAHTNPPAIIAFARTGTVAVASNYYLQYSYLDFSSIVQDYDVPSSGTWYTFLEIIGYGSGSTAQATSTYRNATRPTYITSSSFSPNNVAAKSFRSNYVYGWTAIWAPTT